VGNPCLRGGACCACFRVSFHWAESVPFLDGHVPDEMTETVTPFRLAMKGTLKPPLRCIALDGEIGEAVGCTIYSDRPTPCRDLEPWDHLGQPDEKCSRARAAHGLPPLKPVVPRTPEGLPCEPDRTGTG
jgi:Fe-S-cluster containining protein